MNSQEPFIWVLDRREDEVLDITVSDQDFKDCEHESDVCNSIELYGVYLGFIFLSKNLGIRVGDLKVNVLSVLVTGQKD